jgi:DNA-binding NarL/FixJ family response regulator
MASIPLLVKDDFERPSLLTQIDIFSNSPVNHALTDVAQEVAGMLQQAYPVQADSSNHAQITAIRAVEPKYRQIITTEPLTVRELEVLQLIVDGHSNNEIAQKLYVTMGTVKIHVRNIFKKLSVEDRTQAAIRALTHRP